MDESYNNMFSLIQNNSLISVIAGISVSLTVTINGNVVPYDSIITCFSLLRPRYCFAVIVSVSSEVLRKSN